MGGTTGAVFDEDATPEGGEHETLPQETLLGLDSSPTTTTDDAIVADKNPTDKATTATNTSTSVDIWSADEKEVGSTAHLLDSITSTEGTFRFDPVL